MIVFQLLSLCVFLLYLFAFSCPLFSSLPLPLRPKLRTTNPLHNLQQCNGQGQLQRRNTCCLAELKVRAPGLIC
jgi:hypothetical protein